MKIKLESSRGRGHGKLFGNQPKKCIFVKIDRMKQSGPGVTAQQPGRTLVPERVEEEGQSVFVFCIFVFSYF